MGFLSVCRSLLDKEGSWEGSDLCIFNAQQQSRSPDSRLEAGKWLERSIHQPSSRCYPSLFFLSLAAGMAIVDVSPYCWTVERNRCTKCERPTKPEGLGCVEDGPKDRIKVAHFKNFGVFPTPLDPSIRILRPGLKHCPTAIRDIWDSGCSGRRSMAHGESFQPPTSS